MNLLLCLAAFVAILGMAFHGKGYRDSTQARRSLPLSLA
jgi:hypothetical protein